MRIRKRRSAPRSAFTAFELIVAVAIIAIIAATAVLRYGSYARNRRLEAATRRLVVDFGVAQRAARYAGQPVKITFDDKHAAYQFAGLVGLDRSTKDYAVSLASQPYGVEIRSVSFDGGKAVTFNGYGVPSAGGEVVLGIDKLTVKVSLDATSGATIVQ